jgi:cold-inducible RNA-binding protein
MKIYVGNLSNEIAEEDLRSAFEKIGSVESITILKDKFNGQSKGFGFVEMNSESEGRSAIDRLNGTDLKGKSIKVNEARPRKEGRGSKAGLRGGGNGYGQGKRMKWRGR